MAGAVVTTPPTPVPEMAAHGAGVEPGGAPPSAHLPPASLRVLWPAPYILPSQLRDCLINETARR